MSIVMRYPKDQKEHTHRRIVDAASRAFRRDGVVATGVAGLMAEAGLTQGGFYAHFASKNALVAEALSGSLAETRRRLTKRVGDARAAGVSTIGAVIDAYLTELHLDATAGGCTLASVGPELARQSDAVRRATYRQVNDIAELLAAEMPDDRKAFGAPLFALLAGTLQVARMAGTRAEQVQLLDDGRRAARAMVGLPHTD